MKTRLTALVLATMMLLSATSAVACGTDENPDKGSEASTNTSNSEGTSTETVPETVALPNVEAQNYNGATFHMIAHEVRAGTWYYSEEMISSGDKWDVLNNTIYEMNTMVEDHLNIEFTYENIDVIPRGDIMYATVLPSIMAGDDDYQLCITHPYHGVTPFITSNHSTDFYELTDLDLDREYWNRGVIDLLSVNGHAYIGLGDICKYGLNVLYGNRDMLEDAGRTVPYDKVRNGTWTLDAFTSLTAELYRDNGDGIRNNQDTYGFSAMWDINGSTFLQASDIYVFTRGEDNAFELSMYDERLINLYEKLFKWSDDESTYIWEFSQREDSTITMDFHDAQAYFTLEELGVNYLDAEFEISILPMPKYDTEQEDYAHVNWGNNIIVPSSVKNKEMVGQVLEMMAYYSRIHVREAYYNDVLQLRVSEAPDDREMVELICNTVVFDPGIAYCHGSEGLYNLVYVTTFGIREGQENIANYYKRNERTAKQVITKLMKIGI